MSQGSLVWTGRHAGGPREDPTGGVMRRDAVVEEVVEASSGEPAATVSGTPFQVDQPQVKQLQERSRQVNRLLYLEGNFR